MQTQHGGPRRRTVQNSGGPRWKPWKKSTPALYGIQWTRRCIARGNLDHQAISVIQLLNHAQPSWRSGRPQRSAYTGRCRCPLPRPRQLNRNPHWYSALSFMVDVEFRMALDISKKTIWVIWSPPSCLPAHPGAGGGARNFGLGTRDDRKPETFNTLTLHSTDRGARLSRWYARASRPRWRPCSGPFSGSGDGSG